ncbi:MAG: formylglycine-generating enzyme family protein, partial [Bryobacteraceae bacterium]
IEPENWPDQLEHGNRPIVGVSWFEAAAYCTWAGGRLPTEAEWEHAARGGRIGCKYTWGNEPPDPSRANYGGNVGHPTPVGLYPKGATTDGICDMLGNVLEWCVDWWDDKYYAKSETKNPRGPQKGDDRLVRGGSWVGYPRVLRVSVRDGYGPGVRNVVLGFRCVREVIP